MRKKRFLKPGGVLIPRAMKQFVAPVIVRSHPRRVRRLGRNGLRSVRRQDDEPQQHLRAHAQPATSCSTGARRGTRSILASTNRSSRKGEASWKFEAGNDLRLCDVVERGAGAGHRAFDGAGCAAHALGAALFSAAVADRGQARRYDRRSTCARAPRADAGTHVAWVATQRDAKGRELRASRSTSIRDFCRKRSRRAAGAG